MFGAVRNSGVVVLLGRMTKFNKRVLFNHIIEPFLILIQIFVYSDFYNPNILY